MEIYDNEEQQVEAIKEWWKENGKSIIIGVAVGLAGILGWRYYQDSVQAAKEAASHAYTQVSTGLAAKGLEAASETQAFIDANKDTAYAVLAAMQLAKVQVEAGELDKGLEQLQWALSNTKDSNLQPILNFRIARILLEQQQFEQANSQLDAIKAEQWQARVQELRGDIALQQGDLDAARSAYTQAQQAGGMNQVIQMKLDDLAK